MHLGPFKQAEGFLFSFTTERQQMVERQPLWINVGLHVQIYIQRNYAVYTETKI